MHIDHVQLRYEIRFEVHVLYYSVQVTCRVQLHRAHESASIHWELEMQWKVMLHCTSMCKSCQGYMHGVCTYACTYLQQSTSRPHKCNVIFKRKIHK